ncbi:hypothetical protein GCM10023147_26880 [Tsukamurella soli]|uniref:Hsp70 protein n=1 Tax=Tsukamurella soli TaxID=644556 RepID=A0ABP8JRI6_9ACTN
MATASLGASIDHGLVYCSLIATDGGEVTERQTRAIHPGGFPSICPAERITSGFDLLEAYSDEPITAYGIACRRRRDVFGLRLRSVGPRRTATIVGEIDAILRSLDATGAIARYDTVLLVDVGAGLWMSVVEVASGTVRWRGVLRSAPADGAGVAARVTDALRVTSVRPQAMVLYGVGAAMASVADEVRAAARDASPALPVIIPTDPEGVLAAGAALVAADAVAARATAATTAGGAGVVATAGGGAASRRPARRLRTVDGGTWLTGFALPLMVLAGLLCAGLVATLATGAIGSVGDVGGVPPQTTAQPAAETADGPIVVGTGTVATVATEVNPPVRTTDDATPPGDRAGVTVLPPVVTTYGREPAMTIFATPPPTVTQHTTTPTAIEKPSQTRPSSTETRTRPTGSAASGVRPLRAGTAIAPGGAAGTSGLPAAGATGAGGEGAGVGLGEPPTTDVPETDPGAAGAGATTSPDDGTPTPAFGLLPRPDRTGGAVVAPGPP